LNDSQAVSFPNVQSVTVAGGPGDRAFLYDSPGNDTLVGAPTYVSLSGPGYSSTVTGFAQVTTTATTGADQALLLDGSGDDVFRSTAASSYLEGSGFLNTVTGFAQVSAAAGAGGTDQALLYGAQGGAGYVGQGSSGALLSASYTVALSNFAQV